MIEICSINLEHMQRPLRRKLASIKLSGPHVNNENVYVWVVYYELPVNKSHEQSQWTIHINNTNINVYNGIIIIHTRECISNVPDLSTCIDVNTDVTSFVKEQNKFKTDVNIIKEDIDDGDADADADAEDIDVEDNEECRDDNSATICSQNKEEYDEDADDIDYEDDAYVEEKGESEIDLTEPSLIVKKDLSITLKNDLSVEKKNLEYEPYDYEASIIPPSLK